MKASYAIIFLFSSAMYLLIVFSLYTSGFGKTLRRVKDIRINSICIMGNIENAQGKSNRYTIIKKYSVSGGITPHKVDIHINITNNSQHQEINEIRLSITPKVGKILAIKESPDMTDSEATRQNAVWMSTDTILRKNHIPFKPFTSQTIIFKDIDIDKMIKTYSTDSLGDYYPVELKFEVTVNPLETDKNQKNNTLTCIFPLELGD